MYIHVYIKGDFMDAVLKQWGNSIAIRIPQKILKKIDLKKDQKVDLIVEKNSIIIKPKNEPTLDQLLSKIDQTNLHTEIKISELIGKEIW